MEKLFIYKDGASNKFWNISCNGNSYTVTYGKIGTAGAVKTKKFESDDQCRKEGEKLIKSKMNKGYVEADSEAEVVKDSAMNETLFWELLETARKKGEDPEEQLEWLVKHLSRRPIKDIVLFDYFFNKIYRKSYTSNLWAAAYIIMGGCSDDCFDYFRAWLLFLGRETYDKAMEGPEILLPHLKKLEEEGEVPQFEELLFAASQAFEEKTGRDDGDYYDLYHQLTKDEYCDPDLQFDWDEDDEEGLKNKYPLLWAAYGENPLEY